MLLSRTKEKIPWILLIFAILIVNALYWCTRKEGYYIDELWSYGLSNSYYMPFLHQKENYMNNWHQPVFYEDYLMIRQNETFSYDSVYDNQVQDVHPPFYYILLNTICSLFSNRFSKWFGLLVNLPFYCGSVFLLYKISGQLLGKRKSVRFIPPFLYGLSMGAVSTLIYIRMYMLLTFWALLFVFLVFYLINEDAHKKRILILFATGLTITAGFLTQYYFIIFLFFFSVAYVIWNMAAHQWRRAAEYLFTLCTGVAIGILIFPASLNHIFLGQQGRRAFINAANGIHLFLKHWSRYRDTVLSEFFGNGHIKQFLLLFVFLIIIFAAMFSVKKKNQKICIWDTVPKAECLMLLTAVCGYFSVIVQISPEVVDRYQFIIYPFCVLITVAVEVYLLRQLGKERVIWIITGLCLVFMVHTYMVKPVPYVYEGYQEVLDMLGTEYKNVPGIYVTAGDHLVINNCLFLAQQNMTYPLTAEQIDELPEICKEMDTEQMILYVDIYYDEQQTAERIAELLEYRSYEILYDNTFTQIYLLSR